MAVSSTQFIEIAESLPIDMKATLVDHLLNGIDPTHDGVDIVWKIEAKRRLDDVRAGGLQMLPIATVFEEIRKRVQG